MKRLLLIILTFALACCCLLFSGCKGAKSYEGTYKFKELKVEEHGTEFSFEVGDKFEGMRLTEDFVTVTIDEEKAIVRICMYEEEGDGEIDEETEVYVYRWVNVDDEAYFYAEGDSEVEYIAKKDGKTLTIDVDFGDAMTIVLEK